MLTLILRIALRNPWRHKLRSSLTVAGIVVAILSFGLLSTVVTAWYAGADAASDKRLIVRNSISMTFSMPLAYADRIRAVDGVNDITWSNWFGGVYIDQRNFFPQFAVDAASYFRLYPEFVIPPDQYLEFLRDRRGAVAGRKLAQRFGWKVGDVIPLKGTIFPGDYQFVLRAIYSGARSNTDENQFMLHWDFLNERIKQIYPGAENQAGIYIVGIRDGREAATASQRIDALFHNSIAETLTETEKAFQLSFVAMTGTIVQAIQIVSWVIIAIIMAVMANTMAMASRERTAEYATLKALGFRPWVGAALVYAESLTLALVGATIGIWATGPAAHAIGTQLDNIFPTFQVAAQTVLLQWLAAIAVACVAAAFPARRAMRVKIIEGLRSLA